MAILVDTGVFYGLYDKKDSNHESSVALVAHALAGRWGRVFLSSYVVLETTLLLRSKMCTALPRTFLGFVEESGMAEVFVDEETNRQAKEIFRADPALSLTDSASVVFLRSLQIRWLGTFDERRFRRYSRDIVGPSYWETLGDEERARLKKAGLR